MEEVCQAQLPKAKEVWQISKNMLYLRQDGCIHQEIHLKPVQAVF